MNKHAFRRSLALLVLPTVLLCGQSSAESAPPAGEYVRHLAALGQLSVGVAQAMPADKYGFMPHPESMTFGELMAHIATTNYQFCAGLNDSQPPALPRPPTGTASRSSLPIHLSSALRL